jgi:hypothetical protein
MKRFLNYFDRDSTLFFPYDHTKPSKEALEEMANNWFPTRQRLKSAARLASWYLAIILLGVIVATILIAHGPLCGQ